MASNQTLTVNVNVDLIANDNDIQSSNGIADGAIEQYEVLMRSATDGESLEPYTAAEGTTAIGIAMEAAADGEQVVYWTAGGFHHHKLIWPSAADSVAKRRAAFDSSPLAIV